jgi:hypothetical protein
MVKGEALSQPLDVVIVKAEQPSQFDLSTMDIGLLLETLGVDDESNDVLAISSINWTSTLETAQQNSSSDIRRDTRSSSSVSPESSSDRYDGATVLMQKLYEVKENFPKAIYLFGYTFKTSPQAKKMSFSVANRMSTPDETFMWKLHQLMHQAKDRQGKVLKHFLIVIGQGCLPQDSTSLLTRGKHVAPKNTSQCRKKDISALTVRVLFGTTDGERIYANSKISSDKKLPLEFHLSGADEDGDLPDQIITFDDIREKIEHGTNNSNTLKDFSVANDDIYQVDSAAGLETLSKVSNNNSKSSSRGKDYVQAMTPVNPLDDSYQIRMVQNATANSFSIFESSDHQAYNQVSGPFDKPYRAQVTIIVIYASDSNVMSGRIQVCGNTQLEQAVLAGGKMELMSKLKTDYTKGQKCPNSAIRKELYPLLTTKSTEERNQQLSRIVNGALDKVKKDRLHFDDEGKLRNVKAFSRVLLHLVQTQMTDDELRRLLGAREEENRPMGGPGGPENSSGAEQYGDAARQGVFDRPRGGGQFDQYGQGGVGRQRDGRHDDQERDER